MRNLIKIELWPPDNTLAYVKQLLILSGLIIDEDYGLVSISPKRGLYVIRVSGHLDPEKLLAMPEIKGVHGDIQIAPMDSNSID